MGMAGVIVLIDQERLAGKSYTITFASESASLPNKTPSLSRAVLVADLDSNSC
jgi:hypothetical protein